MTERPTYPKSLCCIPGCPHWSRRFPAEWMCGRHWRMAPRRVRSALRKVWREYDAMVAYDRATPRSRVHEDELRRFRRLELLDRRLWGHAKRRVILRDAGL